MLLSLWRWLAKGDTPGLRRGAGASLACAVFGVIVGCIMACAAGADGTAVEVRLLWGVDTDTGLYTAATVADIDGDGLGEIVAAGYNSIMAYDGEGKRLWEFATEPRFCTYPSVLLRQGQPALIYAADNAGGFICLSGDGEEAWRARLNAPSNWSAAVLCDVDSDGKTEVIQTDEAGTVWAFDALTGKVLWQTALEGSIGASPSVGELTGGGDPEIAVVTEAGIAAVLRSDGTVMWSRQMGRELYSAPVIFTASDGGGRVAFGSGDGECFCLDGEGTTLWRRATGSDMDSSVSVGDLDTDGRADIFAVTQSGLIERLDEDGSVLWKLDMQMRTDAAGAIADINGDGSLEYVLCTHKARVLALDVEGVIVFDYQLDANNAYNATPTFGDVTNASPGREMVICGGDGGVLFCFATPVAADGPMQWGGVRRDLTMAGSWPGLARSVAVSMTPQNLAWNRVLTGQGVRFRITNAGMKAGRLRAEASCITPDGARRAVTADIATPEGELVLPLDVLAPGVYDFSWSLRNADGKVVASGARDVSLEPFANERGTVAKAASDMRAAASFVQVTLPLSAAALVGEARLLEDGAGVVAPDQEVALHADAATQERVLRDTAALVRAALRGERVAEVIRDAAALGPGTSVVAFEEVAWENLGVDDLLPRAAANPLEIARRVVPGEHDCVPVNVFNITDRELEMRVVIEAPPGVTVVPHRAQVVPTAAGDMSWDALPELDDSVVVSVPSLKNRQLWLDVGVGEVAAGEYEVKVRLQALNGAGVLEAPKQEQAIPPPEALVDLRLNVLPFEMAPPGSFRLCTWAYVESSQYKDIADATYANLFEHGNNVWTIGGLPEAEYDEQGRLVGRIDYTKLDAAVERWRGKDVVLLLNGFPPLKPVSGTDGYGSPGYRKALKPYLDDLVAHMAALGFPLDRWAFYPIDEAGGDGWRSINAQAEFGKMMRAANPNVLIYADAGGPDPAMLEAIADYVDIWSPGVNMVATEPEKFGIMKATGKTLWSYNCSYNNYNKLLSSGRTLKAADIVSEYRIAGIWAFRHGLTGAGFWTSITNPEDPWTRTQYEYPMLYTGRTQPVTSRRWDAVREGIEDFRILTALKARLAQGDAGALPDAVRARIAHLIEVSIPHYIDGVTDEAGLDRLRAEMMDCARAAGTR
ncbi:MAG: PQQ-binding-like beta-propeller repeat protein [Armatimonadota bacterium]|nr:MAG: PQQ-binding-like beta-propeller repeat protein [Armatimonadota bacterium]